MTSRKVTGLLVFLVPLALGAIASGWFSLLIAAREELEVSLTTLGLASLGGIVGLVAGPLVDWKGSRPLVAVGGLVAALGLLMFSLASSLPIALAGGVLASAGVGLAGGIVIRVLVANWFVRYRGTFLGLALLGSGLGSRVASTLDTLVDDDSWRVIARLLALGGVGVAVAGFALIRSYPASGEEDDLSRVRVAGRRSPRVERMIQVSQYVRSPGLWPALGLLGVASALVLGVNSGLRVHLGPFALEESASVASLGLVLAFFQIGGAVGGLVWGVGADFWARNRLFWLGGLGAVVALVLLSFSSPGIGLRALLVLAGLFLGGLEALIWLTFVDYMGVRLLGTMSLAFGFLASVGGVAGPPVAGLLFDVFGTYQWWFLMGVPLLVLAVLAATRAPYPVIRLARQAPTS